MNADEYEYTTSISARDAATSQLMIARRLGGAQENISAGSARWS